MQIIQEFAPNAKTFCDIFSGTGTVANQAIANFENVIINDILFSNQVIIQKELLNLQKRTASKDDVLKFLVAPVRLEFLTALSIIILFLKTTI